MACNDSAKKFGKNVDKSKISVATSSLADDEYLLNGVVMKKWCGHATVRPSKKTPVTSESYCSDYDTEDEDEFMETLYRGGGVAAGSVAVDGGTVVREDPKRGIAVGSMDGEKRKRSSAYEECPVVTAQEKPECSKQVFRLHHLKPKMAALDPAAAS
jgi:hypothetical protein